LKCRAKSNNSFNASANQSIFMRETYFVLAVRCAALIRALDASLLRGKIKPMKAQAILTTLLILFCNSFTYAQKQIPTCESPIEYGNRNQVDPERSSVRDISGRVIAEVGSPAKEIGSVPACLGLFTEKEHRLVASVVANDEGYFKFNSIPPGKYRLIVRDPQNAFCVANMPLRVVRGPRGTGKTLVIHMRPVWIDDCSYGDFK
jgi:hypothetical protein